MENASKALLIAGGVLVTLAVVSIIMIIFNKGRDFNKTQVDSFDKKKIAYHNSQFTIYERKLEKSEIEKLIDVAIKNNINAENKEYVVSVIYNGVNYSFNPTSKKLMYNGNDLEDIKHDSLDKFNCYTKTNTYGIITEIYINKI